MSLFRVPTVIDSSNPALVERCGGVIAPMDFFKSFQENQGSLILKPSLPLITIDGNSGVGKTLLATKLVQHSGFVAVEGGYIFRASSRLAQGANLADLPAILATVNLSDILDGELDKPDFYVGAADVANNYQQLKPYFIQACHRIAGQIGQPSIFIGRNAGSEIFPRTPHQIMLFCSNKLAAMRKAGQLEPYEEPRVIERQTHKRNTLAERDFASSNYLKIDTTKASPDQVMFQVLRSIQPSF